MKLQSLFKFNHHITKTFISKNSFVIDATCGNGLDTKYLASLIPQGHVYAFDIQQEAILNTKALCSEFDNITYINASHEQLKQYVTKQIDLVVFNLGYLPGIDNNITTTYSSTIKAIKASMDLLKTNGCIILTIYTKHDNYKEATELEKFIKTINKYQFSVLKYQFLNLDHSPYSIFIEKK